MRPAVCGGSSGPPPHVLFERIELAAQSVHSADAHTARLHGSQTSDAPRFGAYARNVPFSAEASGATRLEHAGLVAAAEYSQARNIMAAAAAATSESPEAGTAPSVATLSTVVGPSFTASQPLSSSFSRSLSGSSGQPLRSIEAFRRVPPLRYRITFTELRAVHADALQLGALSFLDAAGTAVPVAT
eukprot:5015878-Pleurochrysis_carterae.AAC.2